MIKDGQRQPGGGGIASGGQRAAPLRQRPGRLSATHLGAPKAITATWLGSSTPCCATARSTWRDYEKQYQDRALRAAKRRAAQLGYDLVPMSDAPEHATHAPGIEIQYGDPWLSSLYFGLFKGLPIVPSATEWTKFMPPNHSSNSCLTSPPGMP